MEKTKRLRKYLRSNVCPQCEGQATAYYYGPIQGVKRKCVDCELVWWERHPKDPQ